MLHGAGFKIGEPDREELEHASSHEVGAQQVLAGL